MAEPEWVPVRADLLEALRLALADYDGWGLKVKDGTLVGAARELMASTSAAAAEDEQLRARWAEATYPKCGEIHDHAAHSFTSRAGWSLSCPGLPRAGEDSTN